MSRWGLVLCWVSLCVTACDRGKSDTAYIPDSAFQITVTIDAPQRGKVDQWIPLHAARKSGPWKKVARSQVPTGVLPLPEPPLPVEDNVQNNLRWVVDPPDTGRFNLPGSDTDVTTRAVKFAKPGTYKLTGYSSFPAAAQSNTISIEIEWGAPRRTSGR